MEQQTHNQDRLEFAEEMGFIWEQIGSTRMLGRVFGALMVADPPEISAEDLAAFLHASRGSISQTTRHLIQMGLVERVRRAGVRRDYFRVRRNAWVEASRHRITEVTTLQNLFRRGLRTMSDAPPESRRALEESLRFMEFWEQEFRTLFDRWTEQMENIDGDRHSDV